MPRKPANHNAPPVEQASESQSGPSSLVLPGRPAGGPDPVLLAVTGMSPAILTETIWALAHEPQPVLPRRVVVVTTTEGRRHIQEQLFAISPHFSGRTPWDALRDALAADGHCLDGRLQFGTTGDDIRVITALDPITGRTRELADIRSPADNEATADFLLEQVRQIVENPDTLLVASVAGGRKTMGALLYACLTLVGRETDRLTHVLVSEPFETMREFYFPSQPGGELIDRERRAHPTSSATLELADVLFVPLRNHFTRELGRKAGTFSRLVQSCREQGRLAARANVSLSMERGRCEIEVNGTQLRPAPLEYLVLLCLAERRKGGEPALDSFADAVQAIESFRVQLARTAPIDDFSDWRHGPAVNTPFSDEQQLRRAVSSLRSKLRETRGNAPLLVACLPEKGRFSLDIAPSLLFLK